VDREVIGIGIIGLGFIGRAHLRAYQSARQAGFACRLVAVCDQMPKRRAGLADSSGSLKVSEESPVGDRLFDPGPVRAYAEADALLADAEVGLVSICTYTDTHADLAVRALRAGKHVLIEKPVAVAAADVQRVADAAGEAPGQVCMPAMCMRFWPGWSWIKERIERQTSGPVVSASFHRLSSRPNWAAEFYRDCTRSGGALVDLHIHDADFVRWCFGTPDAVLSTGSTDHVTTIYRYARGPTHVVAEGGWDHANGFPFRMGYVVNFAEATAVFDLGREPALTVFHAGRPEFVPLPPLTGYDLEVRHLLDVIAHRRGELGATIADAVAVARLLEAERLSLETGKVVQV